jgi:hypothetical protein
VEVDQLLEVRKITKKIDPELWVVERLGELSVTMPSKTVQCLGLTVDGDEKGWGILGLSCLSWKWRKRSSVKITERTHEETTETLHAGRESRHSEETFVGRSADLGPV